MQLFVYRTLHHVCIARPYYKILWYFFGICYKCNNNHSTKNKQLFVAWLGNKTGKKKQELFNIFWSIRHAIDVFFVLFGLLPSQTKCPSSCMSVWSTVCLHQQQQQLMVLQFKFPNLYMHHVDNILLQFCHIYDSSLVPNAPLLLRLLVATVKPICKPFHVPCHRHCHSSRLNHQHRCPRQADRQTDRRPFETALKYLTSPFSQRVTVSTVGAYVFSLCFFSSTTTTDTT